MSKKAVALLFLLIISPVVLYFLWPSDENRIRKQIKEGAEAVEAQDIDGVMGKVSRAYSDEHGLNYLILRKVLENEFGVMSGIDIDYSGLKIAVDGRDATATMGLSVKATIDSQAGYVIGGFGTPETFTLKFKKEGGTWLVLHSEGLKAPPGFGGF